MQIRLIFTMILLQLALYAPAAWSGTIDLPYSGRMVEDTGAPVEGPVDIMVHFYTSETGETGVATPQIFQSVPLSDGVFQINFALSSRVFHSIFRAVDKPTWIQITDATHGKFYPRQMLAAVPYALKVPVDETTIGWNSDGQLELRTDASVNNVGGTAFVTTGATNGQVLSWNKAEKAWKPVSLPTAWSGTGDLINGGNTGAIVVGSSDSSLSLKSSAGTVATVSTSGNFGIGTTSPTAKLQLSAGTAVAGHAPLKLTSGPILTAPEAGAIEYDGSNLYFTNTGAERQEILGIAEALTPISGQVISWNGTAWVPTTPTGGGGGGSGTVTSIIAGTGLSGGTITGSGTIALANTAVTPAAYTRANITVDAQGRITAAANGGAVNLATDTTGTLSKANGGTGATSLGTNAVLTSNGSGTFSAQSGTSSQVLIGSAVSNPSFGQISDGQIAPAAAIARTKIATGTLNHVVINDASGNLTSEAQLNVSRGGTGAATAANNLIFAGPTSGGPAAPSFRSLAASDLPAPGGDLSGSFATATVDKIRGVAVSATAPTTGQVLSYDGSSWVPASAATGFTGSLAGDVTGTQGATAITAATVTGKALTGYVSGAGTVAATDSILGAINKLNGNDALKAPIASPTFTGTVTSPAFSGPLTGNVTGNVSGTAGSFTGSLVGDVTGTQGATAISAATVTGKAITGFTSGAGTVAATDTILGAIQKIDGNDALKAPIASPTFTGTVTAPIVKGGSATTSALTYKATSGVGTTGADHIFQVGNNGATEAMRILNSGNVGVGTTAPTAALQLKAGAAAAGGAPLKLTSGTNLTTAEAGAIEFNGTDLFYTNGAAARQKIPGYDNSLTPLSGQVLSWDGSAWAPASLGGSGTVTSITAGTGLSGGAITGSGTIALANTAVTPAAYTRANITVDAQGRITAAANGGSVNLTTDVSGTLPAANGGTGATSLGTNAVLTSNGSGTFSAQSGTSSQVLIGSAVSNPSFGQISDGQIAPAAAIARTKIAGGTTNHVLINDVSGNLSSEAQLDVSRGGTGAATAANNLIFAGPTSGGPAAPGFRSLAASDLPAPGGDLSGSFATATVAKIRGVAVSATAPTTGQLLSYDGASWVPISAASGFTGSLSGDVTGTQSATAISAATVTGKALTGYISGAGTVAATDSILSAVNKLNGNDALKAPIASPTFTGTVTAPAFSGPLTGNVTGDVTGNVSGTAGSFTGSLVGDVTGTQGATAISAATVIGKAITGFTSGAGTVAATDTILGAIQKIDGNDALKAPIASPTFTGTVTAPIVKGGSATTSALTYKATSGVGTTGADHIFQVGNNGATEAMRILNSGNVGVGTTAPTAALQLKAGAATAGGAPLKLTSGTNLTTAEAGAIEFNGTDLFYTNAAAARQKIPGYDNSLTPLSGQVLSWDGSAWTPSSVGAQGIYQTGTQSNYFAGNVGIGTTESYSPLTISSLSTVSSGIFSGLNNLTSFANTTTASTKVYGINNTTYFGGSANSTGAGYGIYNEASNDSGSNVDTMYGSYAIATNTGNGSTVTNQYGSYSTSRALRSVTNSYGSYSLASKPSGDASTVTNAYGSYNAVDNSIGTTTIAYGSYNTVTNGGSLGTGYGLYIGPVAGITNYGIYQEMAGNDNYFAGKIGIGTTTPSAALQLKAGTAAAGNAPLKLTSGTNLTAAEAGAIEYNGTDLFYTNGAAARQKIAGYSSSLTPTSGQVLSWNGSAWAPASVGGSGTVTSITAGTGLSGGAITGSGTIALANTAVTPAAYTRANITVDAQGRITAAANGASVSLTADVTGTLPAANGGTGATSLGTNAVLTSNGSGTFSAQTGTSSQVLIGSAVSNPSFGQIGDGQIAPAAAIARTKIAGGTASHVLINDVSGNLSSEAQLDVSRGGTGAATAANNLIFAGPTTGGPSAPSFRSLAASDLPAPGGDLSGSFATATVAKIRGVAVSATAPTTGQLLSYDGASWVPTSAASGFTGSLAGDVTGTQSATAISAATVTGKALTGYVSGAGTVAATDSILGAINKLNGNDALNAPIASPTFTGTMTAPIIRGGTATTSTLTYKTTSGVGTTGADHIFQVGNNGATEAMRILNNGNVGVGTTAPQSPIHIAKGTTGFAQTRFTNTASGHTSGDGLETGLYVNSVDATIWNNENGLIDFATNNTVRMTVAAGGNVGIGTSVPTKLLHVYSTDATNSPAIMIESGDTGGRKYSLKTGNSTGSIGVGNFAIVDETAAAAARLVIASSGNVGIGTTNPSGLFEVAGGTAAASTNGKNILLTAQNSGTGNQNGGNIILTPGNGSGTGSWGGVGIGTTAPSFPLEIATASAPFSSTSPGLFVGQGNTAIQDSGSSIGIGGYDGVSYSRNYGMIGGFKENATSGNYAGYLAFATRLDGANPAERMRITSAGNVGIGTTVPNALLDITGPARTLTATDGNLDITSNSAQGAGVGAVISFGGQDGTVLRAFANIGGFKDNGTSGNFAGYLGFATRANGAAPAERMRIDSAGNVGIGTTAPTAVLQLKAGTATAGTAPLKLTSGTNLTTAEDGALEYNGTDLFYTNSVAARQKIAGYSNSLTPTSGQVLAWNGTAWAPTTVGGSGTVTSIIAGTGLSGGTITSTGTIALANTAVTAAAYTRANITVDAQGRITAAANGSNVALATEVSGTLPIANGGTGAATAANNLIFAGPTSGGPLAPSFRSLAASDIPAPAGDVSGTFAATTVAKIQGVAVAVTAPTSGQVLSYNGTNWLPTTLSAGSGDIVNNGQNGAVTIGTNDATALTLETTNAARVTVSSGGNVGIGTTGPTAKLDVVGAIRTPTVSIAAGTTTIDTATSNSFSVAFTSNVCAALTLNNVLDGASYTIVATGVTSGTCSFVVIGATVKYYPANAAVTAASVYTLRRVGNVVYVSWISGFL